MKKLPLWSLTPLIGLFAACTGSIDGPIDGTPGTGTGSSGNGTGSTPGSGTGSSAGMGTGSTNGTGSTTSTGSTTGTGSTTSTGTGSTPGAGGGSSVGGTAQGGNVSVSGAAGTATTTGMARPLSLEGDPIYTRFNRLTNDQWERSVQDILKLPAPPGQAMNFESPVAGTTDFANNEHVLTVSNTLWQSYQAAAEAVAALATATDAALARVYTGTDAAGFINSFGRRAYRRPLTAAETQKYQTIFTTGSAMTGTGSTFAKGAALVIRAMLQSPFFLYRTELGTNGAALNSFEVASKLSFWLRNTTPSDALLDSAASGQLDTADGAVALAKTMLEEPTAVAVMRSFHGELLHFDRYSTISKIGVPTYKEAFNAEYEESSYLFFDRIFKSGLGVRDILTSTIGFVGPQTAPLYGVAAPASGYEQRDLGAQRVGYFSQLPYLTLYGFNAEPDSIHRGVTLNLDVLCANPGSPAAMLPPIPTLQPTQTNRDRIAGLTAGCGGECHNSFINPIGFAFENFDGMGQFRSTENGLPINSAGSYPFSEGVKSFNGAGELMQMMANGGQAHACYAKKISSYALQRDIVQSDMPLLDALKATSMATNGSVKQVMLDLVKNAAFRTRVGGTP